MEKKTISEQRSYTVTNTIEAKAIITQFLFDANIEYEFGLPEVDDRYHVWRVPIIYDDVVLGTFIINALTGKVNEQRSTKIEMLVERKKSTSKKTSKNKKKIISKEYKISSLPNMLIQGDSLVALDKLPEESVDLVFTSPPYYNARTEYSEFENYNEYLEFIRDVIKKAKRVLIDGKFFIMNVSPVLIPRANRNESSKRIAVPFDMHRLFIEEGFEFIDDIIWQKPEGAGWASGRGRRFSADRNPMQYKPVPVTESILVYRKKSDKLIDWYFKNHPKKELIEDSKVEDGYEKTNIWYISPARDKRHRAVFPRELAAKVIKYYSFKEDVILDPFGGLGTTGKAALDLGRRFVSIELDEEYFQASISDFNKEYSTLDNEIIIKRYS